MGVEIDRSLMGSRMFLPLLKELYFQSCVEEREEIWHNTYGLRNGDGL